VRRLGFLLRPGWLALVVGVIIFAGACFWVLSPWQFGRNSQRSALNNDITNAAQDPAVPLRQLLPVGVEPPATRAWREVTMAGHYLPAGETVARLRQVNDQPADEVLTPFRTDDGRTMLVDRGWVSPNNGQVPAYAPAPTGRVTLTARMHPEESDPHRPPLTEQGHREIYSINTTVVSDLTGLTVDPGYFALVDNQPGVLNVLPLPQIDSGPFLSYAFQWIVFGAMAIGGLGYFTWREIQPGGALTPEGRARRRTEREAGGPPKVRGRHAVAAMIAEDEARERHPGVKLSGGQQVGS
jgi:cytochrome oxidase assembly protein ShyY1